MTDFLIRYHPTDTTWAEWIASTLEEGGYSTSLKSRGLSPSFPVSELDTEEQQQHAELIDRLFMRRVRRLAYSESLERRPGRYLSVFRHGQRPGEIPTADGTYELRPENVEEDYAHLARLGMRYSIAGIVLPTVARDGSREPPGLLRQARRALQIHAEENPPVISGPVMVRDLVSRVTTWTAEFRSVGLRVLSDGYVSEAIRFPGMDSLAELRFLNDEAGEVERTAKRYAVLSILERVRGDIIPPPYVSTELDLGGRRGTEKLKGPDALALADSLEQQAIDRAMEAVTQSFIERLGDFKRSLENFAAIQRTIEDGFEVSERAQSREIPKAVSLSSIVKRVAAAVRGNGSREVPGLLREARQALEIHSQATHPVISGTSIVRDLVNRASTWLDEFRSVGMRLLYNGYVSEANHYPGMDSLIKLRFLNEAREIYPTARRDAVISILERVRWDGPPRYVSTEFDLVGKSETDKIKDRDAQALADSLEQQAIERAMEMITSTFSELLYDFKSSLERFAALPTRLEEGFGALEIADRTIIVLSPTYIEPFFLQKELATIFTADPAGGLLPVRVRDCEPPGFLAQTEWIDLVVLSEDEARAELLAGARGIRPYRCMAPAREPFVQRQEYEWVVATLCAEEGRNRPATVGLTTALLGAGGFGKTAIAVEVCYDERVRQRYPDGILWITLGEDIDVAGQLARLWDLIRWWAEEDPPLFETVSAAGAHLRRELAGKRVLLVVDDVWRAEDVTPFQGFGPRAALLLTTRNSRTLPADSVPIQVDAMEVAEAVRLLGVGLPNETGESLRGLAARLGAWPLLLQIVNRQLRELTQQDGLSLEQSIWEVNEALDTEGLTVFDREDLESRGQAVARVIGASLRRLSAEEVGRFEQLAIFPEDKDIPLQVLENLWGLGSFATRELCGRLDDISLLLRFDRAAGTIRIHDVIRAYLVKKGESEMLDWNRRLLDTYRPASGRWPDLPRDESYLWHSLVHHLIGAGQSDVCRDLLLDFRYLVSKLGATGLDALLVDYSFFEGNDEELPLVRDALRLSAHVLIRDPQQLAGQLLGRLIGREEDSIRRLLESVRRSITTAWLCPRPETLTGPGGALVHALDEGAGRIRAVAVVDGRRVVSGSDDGTLRLWDLETGLLKTLSSKEG